MRKSTRVWLISTVLQIVSVSVAYAAEGEDACIEGEAEIAQGHVFEVDAYALADTDESFASDGSFSSDGSPASEECMPETSVDASCDGICADWCAAVCELDPAQLG